MNGRRTFFKNLIGIIGGIIATPQMRVRAMERENAKKYECKFRENSLPESRTAIATSGCYVVTGSYVLSGVRFPVSG